MLWMLGCSDDIDDVTDRGEGGSSQVRGRNRRKCVFSFAEFDMSHTDGV